MEKALCEILIVKNLAMLSGEPNRCRDHKEKYAKKRDRAIAAREIKRSAKHSAINISEPSDLSAAMLDPASILPDAIPTRVPLTTSLVFDGF